MKNTKKKNGAAAKGKGRATLSAQQTIPYLSMHPDGVCKLPGGLYYSSHLTSGQTYYIVATFNIDGYEKVYTSPTVTIK